MGRVVLPKPLRRYFGLRSGSLVSVRLAGDHIELTPRTRPYGLREENGLLLHEGRPGEESDGVGAVRDERDRQTWGL